MTKRWVAATPSEHGRKINESSAAHMHRLRDRCEGDWRAPSSMASPTRTLSKGSLVIPFTLFLLSFVAVVAGSSTSSSSEKPESSSSGVRDNNWSGLPHRLHLEPTDNPAEMLVWWMSPQSSERSVVKYGYSADSLSMRAVNADGPDRYSITRRYTSEHIHSVLLTGLPTKRGVTVYYQVGYWQSGWSKLASFTTRGKDTGDPVRIAVFGDQDKTRETNAVIDSVLREHGYFSFVWMLGDISYADGHQQTWDVHADVTERLYSRLPVMMVVGNHEKEFGAFEAYDKRWRHPRDGEPRYWWSRTEGSVHTFSLSCEHDIKPHSAQYRWLEADLARAAAMKRRKKAPWIVGAIHIPDYTSVMHGESRRLQQVLDPLLRKYHVNVLLSGHDHHYERTYPVYGGGRTSRARGELSNPYIAAVPYGEAESSSQQQLDAIRIIVGTGGRRIRNRCKYEGYSATGCVEEHGYGVVEADRRALKWTFTDTNGRVRDAFQICSVPGCADPGPFANDDDEEGAPDPQPTTSSTSAYSTTDNTADAEHTGPFYTEAEKQQQIALSNSLQTNVTMGSLFEIGRGEEGLSTTKMTQGDGLGFSARNDSDVSEIPESDGGSLSTTSTPTGTPGTGQISGSGISLPSSATTSVSSAFRSSSNEKSPEVSTGMGSGGVTARLHGDTGTILTAENQSSPADIPRHDQDKSTGVGVVTPSVVRTSALSDVSGRGNTEPIKSTTALATLPTHQQGHFISSPDAPSGKTSSQTAGFVDTKNFHATHPAGLEVSIDSRPE